MVWIGLRVALTLFVNMAEAPNFPKIPMVNLFKTYNALIIFFMTSLTTMFILYSVFYFIDYCDAMRIVLTIGHVFLYISAFLMAMFMISSLSYMREFYEFMETINIDSTFTIVAQIFNRRSKEKRVRFAEKKAFEENDYRKMYNEMERNEIL